MKRLIKLLFVASLIWVSGCDLFDNEAQPETNFLKIYDDNRFSASFIPIDVVQAADKGYLILSGFRKQSSNFLGTHVMKVDERGEYISGQELDNDLVHPINRLHEINGVYYFFCMEELTLQAQLIGLNEDGTVASQAAVGTTYPMFASLDGASFVLQSYDHQGKRSVLSVVDATGTITNSQDFDIGAGEDVEDPIISHFNRTGKQLPFFSGRTTDGRYFFNGFYNYTLSLVFTDLSSDTPSGVCQGQQYNGGISSTYHVGADRFAVSRFNFGDNYILPDAGISSSNISSAVDLEGNPFPELVLDARVVLKSISANGQPTLVYGSSTKSGQIVLIAFEQNSGALAGTKHLGFVNPYEIGSFVETEDGGLVVVGTTYVAGRFPRVCLFKLDNEAVLKLSGVL
jgi:hypothetical protein